MTYVLAFTPTYGDLLRDETVRSVEKQRFDGTIEHRISYDNPHSAGRRNVVHQYRLAQTLCYSVGADALLTVEHDIVLPPDAVQRMWSSPGDVVYGVYLLRSGSRIVNALHPEQPVAIDHSLSYYPDLLADAWQRGWSECSGVGLGCTLIRAGVFDWVELARLDDEWPDHLFAVDCRKVGIQQVARFDVPCGHFSNGRILRPERDDRMTQVTVVAQKSGTFDVTSGTVRLVEGIEYDMSEDDVPLLVEQGAIVSEEDALQDHTVDELQGIAREHDIAYSGLRKSELVEAIREVQT